MTLMKLSKISKISRAPGEQAIPPTQCQGTSMRVRGLHLLPQVQRPESPHQDRPLQRSQTYRCDELRLLLLTQLVARVQGGEAPAINGEDFGTHNRFYCSFLPT